MRKIAVLLVLVIVFCSFVGCSNSQNGVKADDGIWSVQKTTDEFGDVTADSQDVISASVQGTYENETTTESNLGVSVDFRKRVDFNHYAIEFQLTENDTSKIQYEEDSYKTLKTKVGEEIQEFYLSLEESSGKLSHGDEVFYEINYGGDYIFSNLYNGKDVKCVIEIDDGAAYSFELKSDNFKSLCEANGITEGAGDITLRESVNFLLQDKGIMIDESCDYLINNYETFEVVETEEQKELLNGTFLTIFLEPSYGDSSDFRRWRFDKYSAKDNANKSLGFYRISEEIEDEHYGFRKYSDSFHGYSYREEMSLVIIDHSKKSENYNLMQDDYEIRAITDNVYIICSSNNFPVKNGPDKSYGIFVRCDETEYISEYNLWKVIGYAQENYIQEIPY